MKKGYWIGLMTALLFIFGAPAAINSSGYPPALINGCVYNPDGTKHASEPRMRITLLQLINHPTTGEPIRSGIGASVVASTSFTFDNIEPGCFRVYQSSLIPAGNYVLKFSELTIPTTTNTFHYQEISTTISDPTVVQNADLHLVVPVKFITGTVLDTTGKPAAGQHVQARKLNTGISEYWNNSVADVKTAIDGTYTIGVSSDGGSYAVDAEGDGESYLGTRNSNLPNRQVVTFASDGTTETKTIDFNDLNKISSTTKMIGQILDVNGLPVKEGIVTVFANFGSNFSAGSYATTDANGKFSLTLSPGLYTIHAQLSQYDEKTWVTYPTLSANVVEGQTLDLGAIKPAPLSTTLGTSPSARPSIVRLGQNALLVNESSKSVKNVRFNESFGTKTYFDAGASSGIIWKNGALIFTKPITVSSNSVSVASTQTTGIVVSKPFTPKGLRVRSVLINDYLTAANRVTYGVSPDGITWLTVVPGQPTNLPTSWNTKNGLRWRATGETSGQTIKIRDLTILYSVSSTVANPKIAKISVAPSGLKAIVTITGKGFVKGSTLYIGSKAVAKTTFVSSKVLRTTILRSAYLNQSYALTVVGPKLNIGTTAKKINPRLLSVR